MTFSELVTRTGLKLLVESDPVQELLKQRGDTVQQVDKAKVVSKGFLDQINQLGADAQSAYRVLIIVAGALVALFLLKFLYNILAGVFGGNAQLKEYRAHHQEGVTPHELAQQAFELQKKGHGREAAGLYVRAGDHLAAATVYAKLGEKVHAAKLLEQSHLYMDAAKFYEQIKQFKEAARCCALDGHYAEAAEALLKAGDEIEAAKNFEQVGESGRAADLYAKNGLLQKAAELYAACGQKDKAAQTLSALVKQGITDDLLKSDDVQVALEECRQFSSAATLYIKKGQFLKAIVALVKGGEVDQAVELYSRMHEHPSEEICRAINFGDRDTALKFAQFFIRSRDQQSAARVFDNIGRYKEAGDLAERYGDHYYAGQMYQLAGEMVKAALAMERAKAFIEAAKCYEETGDAAKAGDMYYQSGKFETALACFKTAGDQAKAVACLRQMGQAPGAAAPTTGVVAAAAAGASMAGVDAGTLSQSIAGSDAFAVLSRTQVFAPLNLQELSAVNMYIKKRSCRRGEVLVESGKRSDGLFVIFRGSAEVYQTRDGAKVALTTLSPGEHFGEISALFDREATATVAATDDLDILFVSRADLETILVTNPQLGLRLYGVIAKVLADRLAKTNTLVDTLQLNEVVDIQNADAFEREILSIPQSVEKSEAKLPGAANDA